MDRSDYTFVFLIFSLPIGLFIPDLLVGHTIFIALLSPIVFGVLIGMMAGRFFVRSDTSLLKYYLFYFGSLLITIPMVLWLFSKSIEQMASFASIVGMLGLIFWPLLIPIPILLFLFGNSIGSDFAKRWRQK